MSSEASENAAPATPCGLMDLDLAVLDSSAPWPFDALNCPFLLPSPPPQGLLQLSLPSPPSTPSWLFEDLPFPASHPDHELPALSPGNFDSAARKVDELEGTRHLQLSSMEDNTDNSHLIKERLAQALRYIKESSDQHVLVQVWAPIKNGDRRILTTSRQPFVLDPCSIGLVQYRAVSLMYMFSVDGDNIGDQGLPGRVYRRKAPEWSPNVQYYNSKEYLRLNHAINYNVRGSMALPVFEPSGQSCVAVIELIMTSAKINYSGEVDKVCKALEAVNLKSTEILNHPTVQICNEGRQSALVEILKTLTVVCEEHKLPLAQTWLPCMHGSILATGGGLKKICSSFDGRCMDEVCMSASDVAFHVIDAHMWGFRDACVEHHLQKGQGVAGQAFTLRRPCFSKDISQFSKTEYPLVHYARMFGLVSCFAICLQSSYTGSDDYVLEFFLPPDCKDVSSQMAFLGSMITMMKRGFQSLTVVGDELNEPSLEITDVVVIDERPPEINFQNGLHDVEREDDRAHDDSGQHMLAVVDSGSNGKDATKPKCFDKSCSSLADENNTPAKRRHGRAEKTISLEALQQNFSRSLKSAAKCLGVCPTTMKRICRQHGISRWPSRKINKVNRSLSKLKQVVESVQGPDGAFSLASVTDSLPIPVGSVSGPSDLNNLGQDEGDTPSIPGFGCHKHPSEQNSADNNGHGGATSSQPQPGKVSHSSSSRCSSGEGSVHIRTSEGSCQGNPSNQNDVLLQTSTLLEVRPVAGNPMATMEPAQELDLKNRDDPILAPTQDLMPTPNLAVSTIKASYKGEVIRFRFLGGGSVGELKNEVANRLKLEMGMFDVKYLDDDHEWVKLACDADLEECMELSRLSGRGVIRLSVNDVGANLGSSCESSG